MYSNRLSGQMRLSSLSAPRRALVRLCQRINYGAIQNVRVHAGEPVLDHNTTVLLDEKLDGTDSPRDELKAADYVICDEVRRLLARLDALFEARIERIEIRAGVPRRLIIETAVGALEIDKETFSR